MHSSNFYWHPWLQLGREGSQNSVVWTAGCNAIVICGITFGVIDERHFWISLELHFILFFSSLAESWLCYTEPAVERQVLWLMSAFLTNKILPRALGMQTLDLIMHTPSHCSWYERPLIHFLLLRETRNQLIPFPSVYTESLFSFSASCGTVSLLSKQLLFAGTLALVHIEQLWLLIPWNKESSGVCSATSQLACKFSLNKLRVVTAPWRMWKAGSPYITNIACW